MSQTRTEFEVDARKYTIFLFIFTVMNPYDFISNAGEIATVRLTSGSLCLPQGFFVPSQNSIEANICQKWLR